MQYVELPIDWWKRYSLSEAPVSWMNPHMQHVWDIASEEKKRVALMVIGILKEHDLAKRKLKLAHLQELLHKYDVWVDLDPKFVGVSLFGEMRDTPKLLAAMMEVYSPTGLYSRNR